MVNEEEQEIIEEFMDHFQPISETFLLELPHEIGAYEKFGMLVTEPSLHWGLINTSKHKAFNKKWKKYTITIPKMEKGVVHEFVFQNRIYSIRLLKEICVYAFRHNVFVEIKQAVAENAMLLFRYKNEYAIGLAEKTVYNIHYTDDYIEFDSLDKFDEETEEWILKHQKLDWKGKKYAEEVIHDKYKGKIYKQKYILDKYEEEGDFMLI